MGKENDENASGKKSKSANTPARKQGIFPFSESEKISKKKYEELEKKYKISENNYRILEKKYRILEADYKKLQGKFEELQKEQEYLLESASKAVLYLRRMQDRIEDWNRQDGKFFGSVMPMVQMLYGSLDAGKTERAEAELQDLKGQIRDRQKALLKDRQFWLDEISEERLDREKIDAVLKNYTEAKGRFGKSVIYQNLLFPLLCILADTEPHDPDGEWKREIDEMLQTEGLLALYYDDERLKDDAEGRSSFMKIDRGVETPGIFRDKKVGGYKLFGRDYQGFVKRNREEQDG